MTAGVDVPLRRAVVPAGALSGARATRRPLRYRPLPGHPPTNAISRRRRMLGCAVVAFLPVPIALALGTAGPNIGVRHWREFWWSLGLCGAGYIMCVAANAAWSYVDNRSHLVDEVMHASIDRGHLAAWLDKWYGLPPAPLPTPYAPRPAPWWSLGAYRWGRQLVPIVAAAFLSAAFLTVFRHSIEQIVDLPAASYFTVMWVSAIGINCIYWFAVAPHVVRVMSGQRSLLLHWYDPASTPALRMLGKGLLWSANCLAVGSLGVFGVGFVAPAAIKVRAVDILVLGFAGLAIVLLINSSVIPFIHLLTMAGRTKTESLRRLSKLIGDLHNRLPPLSSPSQMYTLDAEQGMLISIYRSVSTASPVPFATAAAVQYGAVIAAGILTPLFGIVSTILKAITK